jgi:hypothetical protein
MRVITSPIIILLFYFCFYTGCLTPKESSENKHLSDKEIVAEALKDPEKHFENFRFNPDSEFHQRVTAPPHFILNYIMELDQKDYTSYKVTKEELKIVESSVKQLPPLLRRMLKEKVIEVYFINDFLGSGMTDWVVDSGKNLYFVMYFNPITLKMDMSEWLTYKEKTCFINDIKDMDISVNAGKKYSAFLGILLHEAVHVADYSKNITPFVEENTRALSADKGEKIKESPFIKGIWKNIDTAVDKFEFKERKKISFYSLGGGPKLKISDAVDLYKQLSASPFVSLYGSLSWSEDLSEYLLFYHLTLKLGQPYIITVLKNGNAVYLLEPMKNERVKERTAFLELFYK